MESVRALRYVNIAALVLVAAHNAFDCIQQKVGAGEFVVFTVPFLLVAAFLCVFKHYKINALLYGIMGIVAAMTGSTGNFSGAIFLMFSIYIFRTPLSIALLLGACSIATTARYLFMDYTIPDTLNQFVVYGLVLAIYFILMHPKPEPRQVVAMVDDTDIEIVNYLQDGMQAKEISAEIGLSPSAIYKRIERARARYFCDSNIELAQKFARLGLISPKPDNAP